VSSPSLAFVESVARQGGAVLREGFGKTFRIDEKGRSNDLVTEYDKKTEAAIVAAILAEFPDHGILAEEGGESVGASPWRWIIDPLDGTTSFAHGQPGGFAVSIGLQYEGVTRFGAVYEPLHDEMFLAELGQGATLNGRPIRTSTTDDLSRSLLATGMPYRVSENPCGHLDAFVSIVKKARGIRRLGAASLDLAYVACGRFEGYWEILLKPWDCAAGVLLVTEAGGRVTDYKGGEYDLFGLQMLSSNGPLHQTLLAELSPWAHLTL